MISIKEKTKNILLRIQEKVRIDLLYVAGGGFWLSSAFLSSSLLSLVQVIIFANVLPKEVYGSYKYILSLAGTFSFITLTGMNMAVTQAASKGASLGILPYAVKVQLKWNFLFTTAMTILAGYYFINDNTIFALSTFVLGFTFPLATTFNTYGAFLSGRKEFRRASLYNIVTVAIQLTSMAVGALLTTNIFILVVIYGVSGLLPNLFFYLRTLRLYKSEPIQQHEKEELVTYSKHLSLMHILSGVAQYADKLVIFHYIGAIELAVYGLALAVPERGRGYIKTLSTIILPKLSEKTLAEIHKTFYKRVFQGMLIGAAISGAYILAAPLFYKIFFPKYLEAIAYSQVFSLTLLFVLPSNYISSVFNAHKMLRPLYFSSLSASITKILLYLVLGKMFGIWGVITAILIMYASNTGYSFYLWEVERRRQQNLHESSKISY